MTDPRQLEQDDTVDIDCEPLSGEQCRVSDVQVEDIGITETFAVTLVSDSEGVWAMTGTATDNSNTLAQINGDREVQVDSDCIERL